MARRAAAHAHEAASILDGMASAEDATLDAVLDVATWAMTAAAVALTQAQFSPDATRVHVGS